MKKVKNYLGMIYESHLEEALFISSNTDEVMSREALHSLSWCRVSEASPVISGALWMPNGALTRAMRTDYPAEGRPHTFTLPTIYRWEEVASGRLDGSRLQTQFALEMEKWYKVGNV